MKPIKASDYPWPSTEPKTCRALELGAVAGSAPFPKTAEAFYRELLEQIAADPRRTRARRLAESGLTFWDSMREEADRVSMQNVVVSRDGA